MQLTSVEKSDTDDFSTSVLRYSAGFHMHYSRLLVIQIGIRLLMTQNLLMGVFCSFLISLNCFVKNPPVPPAGAEY